jgi:hypothetical protein
MCNDKDCTFCIMCDCGHKADEHIAGVGHCFRCDCQQHSVPIEQDNVTVLRAIEAVRVLRESGFENK